jgi:hypothetical protein
MDLTNLACRLTTPELQQRKKTVIKELKGLVLEKEEVANGYRYKFEGTDANLDLLNNFVKTERLCCPFFEFRVTVPGDSKHCWLELSGPNGVKDFIKTEIDF